MKKYLLGFVFALCLSVASGSLVQAQSVVVTNCMCVAPTQTLSYGDRNNDVLNLQKFLVTQNLLGQESTSGYFGPLTLAAVQKFQINNGIASSGDTGYGTVGPATRAKISSMLGGSASVSGAPAAVAASSGNTGSGSVSVTAASLGSGSYSISWSAPGVTYCTSNDFYIPDDAPSATGTATVYGISSATIISVSCFKATGMIQGSVSVAGSGSVATNPTSPVNPSYPTNPTSPATPTYPTTPINPPYVPPVKPPILQVYTYKFRIGDRVTVVRSAIDTKDFYSTSGVVLGTHAIGDKGTVVAGPEVASSSKWWKIDYDSGVDGWNTQDFLILDGTANAGNASGYLILSVANSDDPARMAMAVGDVSAIMVASYTASGQIEIPSNNPDRFVSSNPAVASIDNSGFVTAKSVGSATMTVTMNGKSATMQVTVGPSNAITNPGAPSLNPVKFALRDRVFVVGNNVNTRVTASTGAVLGVHNTSDLGVILAGPSTVGGLVWWQVNYDTGADGWTAEQYLQLDAGNTPVPPTSTPPPAGGGATAKFNMGDNTQILGTNVNTRASASTGSVLGMHSNPDKGSIVGGPTDISGTVWWQVNFDSGVDGWVAEQYLELVPDTSASPKYPISSIKLYGQPVPDGFKSEPNSSLNFPNIEFPVVVDPGTQGTSIPIEMTIPQSYFNGPMVITSCKLTPVLPSAGSAITFSSPRQVTGVAGAYQGVGYVFTGSLPISGGKTPRDLFRWTTSCSYSGGEVNFSNISIILVRPITLAPYCMVGNSFGSTTDQTYAFSVPQNPLRTVSYGDITLPTAPASYDFEILSYLKIYGSGGFSSILPGTLEQYGSVSCGPLCTQYPSALWRTDILAGGANLDGFAPNTLGDDAYKKYVVNGSSVNIKLPGGKIIRGTSGIDDPSIDDSVDSFTEFWPKSPWGAVSGIKMAGFVPAPLWGANNYADVTGTVRTLGEPVINLPMTQAELDAGYSFIQTCEAKYGKDGCGGAAGWLYDPRLNAIVTAGAGGKPSLQTINNYLSLNSTFKNPVSGTPYPDYVIGSCRD